MHQELSARLSRKADPRNSQNAEGDRHGNPNRGSEGTGKFQHTEQSLPPLRVPTSFLTSFVIEHSVSRSNIPFHPDLGIKPDICAVPHTALLSTELVFRVGWPFSACTWGVLAPGGALSSPPPPAPAMAPDSN